MCYVAGVDTQWLAPAMFPDRMGAGKCPRNLPRDPSTITWHNSLDPRVQDFCPVLGWDLALLLGEYNVSQCQHWWRCDSIYIEREREGFLLAKIWGNSWVSTSIWRRIRDQVATFFLKCCREKRLMQGLGIQAPSKYECKRFPKSWNLTWERHLVCSDASPPFHSEEPSIRNFRKPRPRVFSQKHHSTLRVLTWAVIFAESMSVMVEEINYLPIIFWNYFQ